jgi:hypothetical protein
MIASYARRHWRASHEFNLEFMTFMGKARRRETTRFNSRQRAAHRQFPARLPFCPALPDCQTGMFRKNSRTARSRTRTLGALSVLEK